MQFDLLRALEAVVAGEKARVRAGNSEIKILDFIAEDGREQHAKLGNTKMPDSVQNA